MLIGYVFYKYFLSVYGWSFHFFFLAVSITEQQFRNQAHSHILASWLPLEIDLVTLGPIPAGLKPSKTRDTLSISTEIYPAHFTQLNDLP